MPKKTIIQDRYKYVLQEKVGRWKPEIDEEFWYINERGQDIVSYWADCFHNRYLYKTGNVHKTEEIAELWKLRMEGLNVENTAVVGEVFWIWSPLYNEQMRCTNQRLCIMNKRFATEEEAQAWGDKYAEAIIYFQ